MKLRLLALIPAAALVLVIAHDTVAPPRREWGTRAAVTVVEMYRHVLSPRMGAVVTCRFQPTCSLYGLTVLKRDGLLRGGWKSVKRIARCNPWTQPGTIDPP